MFYGDKKSRMLKKLNNKLRILRKNVSKPTANHLFYLTDITSVSQFAIHHQNVVSSYFF